MQLQGVDTSTLQERVYETLRDTILDGRFRPGETFTITRLAEVIGTSVMPVREALARLGAEGAIRVQPGRQIAIPVMSRASVAELYTVRIVVEGMAAAMAAERISAVELELVGQLIQTMDAAVKANDEQSFLRANRAFHFAIYKAGRSHHLLPIIESLWLKFGPLLRVPLRPGSRMEHRIMDGGQRCHEAALNGLRNGDADGARRAIEEDLTETAAWFAEHYDPTELSASEPER